MKIKSVELEYLRRAENVIPGDVVLYGGEYYLTCASKEFINIASGKIKSIPASTIVAVCKEAIMCPYGIDVIEEYEC